jgi:transcriptional regulator
MYVPQQFALSDRDRIVDLIERFDFALMITALDGHPTAVHLPFLYDPSRGEKGTLLAHMAKANPQWQDFEAMAAAGGEALVIFQGPHAYISPNDYRSDKPNVPTWNYLAVHAYGCPRVISEPGAVRDLLSRLSEKQEAGRSQPWRFESLPEKFSAAMMGGIVAFEIPVSRLEAKAKLNQNKPPKQMAAAAAALAAADDPLARSLAEEMKRVLQEESRLAGEAAKES